MSFLMEETYITSVVFNDEALELTFMESRDQTQKLMELRILAFPFDDDLEKMAIIENIQGLLRDLVDRCYAERRAELSGKRAEAKLKPEDSDEE